MQPLIKVRRLHDWAVLPEKHRVDRQAVRAEAGMLESDFRYHRAFRHAAACPPWVMGQEIGWLLPSPLSLTLTPIIDVQVGAEEDLASAGRLLGMSEFWRRGSGYIGTERNSWLRSYQYRGPDGAWESMFIPNGDGTAEWHLGWGLRIPDDYLLLVTGLDTQPDLEIPTGLLTDRQVNGTWDRTGLSVAIRPLRTVQLSRGQPFARMVLLHRDSLQAKLEEVT